MSDHYEACTYPLYGNAFFVVEVNVEHVFGTTTTKRRSGAPRVPRTPSFDFGSGWSPQPVDARPLRSTFGRTHVEARRSTTTYRSTLRSGRPSTSDDATRDERRLPREHVREEGIASSGRLVGAEVPARARAHGAALSVDAAPLVGADVAGTGGRGRGRVRGEHGSPLVSECGLVGHVDAGSYLPRGHRNHGEPHARALTCARTHEHVGSPVARWRTRSWQPVEPPRRTSGFGCHAEGSSPRHGVARTHVYRAPAGGLGRLSVDLSASGRAS